MHFFQFLLIEVLDSKNQPLIAEGIWFIEKKTPDVNQRGLINIGIICLIIGYLWPTIEE